MAVNSDADRKRFARVTVYVDLVSEPDLLPLISDCAHSLASTCNIVAHNEIAEFNTSSSSNSASRAATTIALIKLWQAEEADVYTRDVNNTVAFMDDVELLVTDKNLLDGAVTYALYRRQMPVLSLATTISPQLPTCTALQQLLYTSSTADSLEGRREAVRQFFTFPAKDGAYVAVADSKAADGAVVVVDEDGYPVLLPHSSDATTTAAGAAAATRSSLPPPPTLFANVLHQLRSSSEEHISELRRRNPLLPGILEAFHRYQNRGVMRAMLHRGMCVEVAPATENAGLAWVRKFVALTETDGEAQAKKTAAAEAALATFEAHWLEMPLTQKSVEAS